MASALGRISTITKAKVHTKVHAALDTLEDPGEILALSYHQQAELLNRVREGVTTVVAAKSRLQLRLTKLQQESATLDGQARQALALSRDDLARQALVRKSYLAPQIQSLQNQLETLETQQQALQAGAQRLTLRIEALRVRAEAVKAQQAAARANLAIGEAASGLSKEMAGAHAALRRAEERTAQMQARATAITDLTAAGTLPDFIGSDGLGAQLDQLSAAAAVEADLAALKAQIGQGVPPPAQLGPSY